MLAKSLPEGVEKSRGSGISLLLTGRGAGEKPLREGLKGWELRSLPEKFGVKTLVVGADMLLWLGVWGAALFCGICGSVVSEIESLVVLFLFRRKFSLSLFSRTTLAMRSNSAHTPNMRLTPPLPPCSSTTLRIDRKLTTWFINLTSERARASCGFWRMLAKSVTREDTGK